MAENKRYALTKEEQEAFARETAELAEKLKGVSRDEMYFTEPDFAGNPTRVRGSELEAWHKEQAELKEKFECGEIPDPSIPTPEEQALAEELFGHIRTPEEARKAREERLANPEKYAFLSQLKRR